LRRIVHKHVEHQHVAPLLESGNEKLEIAEVQAMNGEMLSPFAGVGFLIESLGAVPEEAIIRQELRLCARKMLQVDVCS
jgi:hypothetical protein